MTDPHANGAEDYSDHLKPVWSPQEMVDLLEAMARSGDRNTLSFTEAANIARSAADVIRYLAQIGKEVPALQAESSNNDVKGDSANRTPNGPEPCITSFTTGRCYSPLACSVFKYCRDRNLKFGMPDEATAAKWRAEALALSPAESKTGDQRS